MTGWSTGSWLQRSPYTEQRTLEAKAAKEVDKVKAAL
jgi:hypothetical protein